MLLNLENNANLRNLDTDNLTIQHVQCNIAQVGRRRTYRAHGRVGRWNSSNCHVQLIVGEKETEVRKFAKDYKALKLSKKDMANKKIEFGEN